MKPRKRPLPPPGSEAGESDRELFERAVGPVRPVGGPLAVERRRSWRHAARSELAPEQPLASSQAEELLLRPLRRGRLVLEASLDLHGLDRRAATQQLLARLADMRVRGQRLLLVICGRGRNSQGQPRLKPWLRGWLDRNANAAGVVAWCPALPEHGGDGAVYLRLRQPGRRRGPA